MENILFTYIFQCTHFSILPKGKEIHCTLLGKNIPTEICLVPKLIYKKVETDCPGEHDEGPFWLTHQRINKTRQRSGSVRTNISAEFGVDPCVDEVHPTALQLGVATICQADYEKRLVLRYSIRVCTLNNHN